MKRITLCLAGVAVAAMMVLPATASAKKTITLSGSTTVAPLAALLIQKYIKVCDHCVGFRLLQGGSDVGVADVAAGRVSIGNSSREPKPTDPGGLVFNKIAGDALCVATNPDNGLQNLDTGGVQSIFGGDVRNWSGVPGATVDGTIDVYVRTAAGGTDDAFKKIFMGTKSQFSGASQKASNGLVQQAVAGNPLGIGYVSLSFNEGLNLLAYNGVACDLRNAKSGQYGGLRNLYMVTNGQPKGRVAKFIEWIQKSKAAAKVTGTEWVPLR